MVTNRLTSSINASTLLLIVLLAAAGCGSDMQRIDRKVDAMLAETTQTVGATVDPRARAGEMATAPDRAAQLAEQPPTVNPDAGSLAFAATDAREAEQVIQRLEGYSEMPADALRMDLPAALAYAVRNSREFRFAEEEYVLSALRLLTERHRWGPRFFDDISASVSGSGDDGLFDTSLALVNELRVTQRLPYGGEVSARALASATEDLHQRVTGENVQSADIILAADVPLLRGAGYVAREDLIQAERNLIYAARDFERFRREFLFDVARDYLNLIVAQQRISNAQLSVESFQQVEAQQEALYEAGRSTPFDAAEAKNRTFEAIDGLNSAQESYRLALDRFKVRLGMPIDKPLIIEPDSLALPTPRVGMDEAVYAAMSFRLDLQTRRDQLADAARAVENARNALLADLDLSASVSVPTDSDRDRAGLRFEPGDSFFQAGITYGLPLDREIERLGLRQAQISRERARRDYDRFRDDIAVSVRGAVRGIDSALFSLQIQEANVLIAEQRQASIEADPARADIRQRTDAISQIALARNQRDSARRDLEVAVLDYLLTTGQLRVDESGYIEPLEGMILGEAIEEDAADEPGSSG
ncbi:MAG: TolC family protein [Planctomycetota bacterium]|nr:TolC family protein [Planctomycetota bacterium]